MNKLSITIGILVTGLFCAVAQASSPAGKLQIVLSRDVVAATREIRLDQIAILTGPQELIHKAGQVTLGAFHTQGQMLYADRNTVLSRLASAGIAAWQVELSGAPTTQIKQHEKSVEPGQITAAAKTYLEKKLEGQKILSMQQVGVIAPVILNDPNATPELSAALSRYQAAGTRKIAVKVSLDGIQVAQREVVFAVQYQVRRAVAVRELAPGTMIQASDIRIEEIEASVPEPANWKEPYGLVVRRRISENVPIHPEWVGTAESPAIIRRNQQVMVQLDTGSIHLSAPGQAMDEGRAGELIRVKRGRRPDERIIYCTIQPDGTVRPQI